MENELFTFVLLAHEGHVVENLFLSRHDADKKFDALTKCGTEDNLVAVAYYCASVGGLVNAWHA